MVKFFVLFSAFFAGCCCGMSMVAKSSKSMLVKGPYGQEKMFVEHSASSDLESSASGYIYQSNGNQPATIVKLGEPGYHEPREFQQLLGQAYNSQSLPHFGHFVRLKGNENEGSHWRSHGEKGGKGYSGRDSYDEGAHKKYHGSHDSGFHKEREGSKKSHHDEGYSYGEHDESSKGESGESFDEKKSHKKGHKTTGFHNIYHKDEFKKQHSFYDEADGSGYYDKYGKGVENYGSEKGGYKKGDHLDSAYHVSDYGKKGGFDKGSFSEGSKGFHEVEGDNSHFSRNSEYGKKGGRTFRKDFGFSSDSESDEER